MPEDFADEKNIEVEVEYTCGMCGKMVSSVRLDDVVTVRPMIDSFQKNIRKGDIASIHEAYGKAKEHYSSEAYYYNMYAWDLVTSSGRNQESNRVALELALKANEMQSGKSFYTLDTLAVCYYELGQLQKAYDIIKLALILSQDYGEVMKSALKFKRHLSLEPPEK